MKIQYKTIRTDRWVFADGEAVGQIQPMLSAAGKWAFIPIQGYETISTDPFKRIIWGKTIGAVRSSIAWQMRQLA